MNLSENTILITGGGSGIGRGLAEAFHQLGNKVIVAGRRESALKEVTEANPGIDAFVLDVDDAESIRGGVARLISLYPQLNAVFHVAGIMKPEDFAETSDNTDVAEATIRTNLLGPIRLNAALLPHLSRQSRAAIMMVSSGLAFVPMATTPTYCASKAAVHSYAQSLRYQLLNTSVKVLELVPPYVRTGLMGERQAADPAAMPLDEFISETTDILKRNPEAAEICVERVKPLRFAERSGKYDAFFLQFNEAMSHHR